MPTRTFPRLEWVVLDGHEAGASFQIYQAEFGDGYVQSARVGHPKGLLSLSLTYDHLYRTPHRRAGRFSEEAVADYLWDFFCARMAEGNSPFIVRFPRDGKDYLFAFKDTSIKFKEAFQMRFYTTGIELGQRRVEGVTTFEDGSFGPTPGAA